MSYSHLVSCSRSCLASRSLESVGEGAWQFPTKRQELGSDQRLLVQLPLDLDLRLQVVL